MVKIRSLMSILVLALGTLAAAAPAQAGDKASRLDELNCLALNIYFEARGEPQEGQFAVALVTMNRVRSHAYPATVCGVVWQKAWSASAGRYRAQFSWTLDGKSDQPRNRKAWETAQRIAYLVYQSDLYDFTHGATHYHAKYVSPVWRKSIIRVADIGQHIFYRSYRVNPEEPKS